MRNLLPRIDTDLLAWRKQALRASLVLLAISALALGLRGLNFGIDFTGGTLLELRYAEPVSIPELRTTLSEGGMADARVQNFGSTREVLVRLPRGSDEGASDRVLEQLRGALGERAGAGVEDGVQYCLSEGDARRPCQVQLRRVEFVGPQVGDELANQGGLAVLYALGGILFYVALRFRWQFALGSVLALIHDVLITLGVFAVFGFEFSLPVLGAVLAVIGYSLNDTIVVYDRIRENFRGLRGLSEVQLINRAILMTLPRTLLTSLTTLLVVLSLLLLGGEVIRGFAIALFTGVVVGTYSSIFVASPVLLWLNLKREDLLAAKSSAPAPGGEL